MLCIISILRKCKQMLMEILSIQAASFIFHGKQDSMQCRETSKRSRKKFVPVIVILLKHLGRAPWWNAWNFYYFTFITLLLLLITWNFKCFYLSNFIKSTNTHSVNLNFYDTLQKYNISWYFLHARFCNYFGMPMIQLLKIQRSQMQHANVC